MATFDQLLQDLHSNANVTDTAAAYIEITEKRQLVPTSDFDTVIAYEGDINSQIIYFKPWPSADGHDLTSCENKELKWKNLSSKVEGTSSLIKETKSGGAMLKWEVPSDLCTAAGSIEISLSFFDKKDGKVVYSWNTASYTGLSIGKTMDSVESVFPAKDEILVIDKDSKNIVAPAGYNNVICNYGDVGIANVYFLIPRYIGKKGTLDVLGSDIVITIYVQMSGRRRKQVVTPVPYTEQIEGREKEGLVFIAWEVPAELTAGEFGANPMQIAVEVKEAETIETADGPQENILKRWFSNVYSQLKVEKSLIQIDGGEGEDPITEEVLYQMIDEYFKVNDIVWDPNEE